MSTRQRLPCFTLVFVAMLFVGADKKPAASSTQIQHWIKQLGDESYKVREEATRNLPERAYWTQRVMVEKLHCN